MPVYVKKIKLQWFTSLVRKETYARDFPLKTTGGATAAKTQKRMWSCSKNKISELIFRPSINVLKKP